MIKMNHEMQQVNEGCIIGCTERFMNAIEGDQDFTPSSMLFLYLSVETNISIEIKYLRSKYQNTDITDMFRYFSERERERYGLIKMFLFLSNVLLSSQVSDQCYKRT